MRSKNASTHALKCH